MLLLLLMMMMMMMMVLNYVLYAYRPVYMRYVSKHLYSARVGQLSKQTTGFPVDDEWCLCNGTSSPSVSHARGVHPPWDHNAFPPCFGFPPIIPISVYISPLFCENYYFPLLWQIPPWFTQFHLLFTYFTCISFPSALTMMHLCITQCTYWTPVPRRHVCRYQLTDVLDSWPF